LDKTQPQTTFAFLHNRDFRADVLFIRSEITVGARSAQSPRIAAADTGAKLGTAAIKPAPPR